tara:strand:- start:309 stop:527 length:219 start_codon:yes stop_codon:yes gene_type:complete
MKLTKQRLIEIVKEEYQNILNESKTVRLGDINMIFHSKDDVQLVGRKGMVRLNKQDARAIKYAIQSHLSIYS